MAVLGDDFLAGTSTEIFVISFLREVTISGSGIDDVESSIDKLLNCIYANWEQSDFTDIIFRWPIDQRPTFSADARNCEYSTPVSRFNEVIDHRRIVSAAIDTARPDR